MQAPQPKRFAKILNSIIGKPREQENIRLIRRPGAPANDLLADKIARVTMNNSSMPARKA